MLDTSVCRSPPEIGSTSSCIFAASARSALPSSAAVNALRSAATRSDGTFGGRMLRPAEHALAEHKLDGLAVLLAAGEVGGARHAALVEVGVSRVAELNQDADGVLGEPFRIHGLDAGPADAAGALHLAAFEGERDLPAAGIAGDDLEFRAEHAVEKQRQVVGRGPRIAEQTIDQLLFQHVLERLHRRVAAHVADIDVAVGAAEIDELAGVVRHRLLAEQRLQHRAGKIAPMAVPSFGATE